MAMSKIKEYLDNNKVHYTSIEHPERYTAQGTAQVTHIKGKEMAKTVIVDADGRFYMVVLPAHFHVDLDGLKETLGATKVDLADEEKFTRRFPECEVGAMPPFGNLYGMDVYVQKELADDDEIAFNAGTHKEVIKIAYKDFENLVHPNVCNVAVVQHT